MYRTRYTVPNGRTHSTSCYARDPDHLVETIARRGMGETWDREGYAWGGGDTPKMPSYHLVRGELAAANHALIWVSMIAVRAGLIDQWAMLNDEGLLHEMAHLMHSAEIYAGGYGRSGHVLQAARDLARKVEVFEGLVPGVHPRWAGEDTRAHRVDEYISPLAMLEQVFSETLAASVRKQLDVFAGGVVAKAADFSIAKLLERDGLDRDKPKGPRGDPTKRGAHRQQLEQREAALQSMRARALERRPKPKAKAGGFATGGVVSVAGKPIGAVASVETISDQLKGLAAMRVPPGMIRIDFASPMKLKAGDRFSFVGFDKARLTAADVV